jgi:hypothetical protein
MPARAHFLATAEDLFRAPDDARRDVVRGVVVEKAAPTGEHADAQSYVALLSRVPFSVAPVARAARAAGGSSPRPTSSSRRTTSTDPTSPAGVAGKTQRRVRAEPFDAVEIDAGLLFGEDPQ